MNPHAKLSSVLLVAAVQIATARDFAPVEEFQLDEHTVYTIPVSLSRVTTLNFPGPISAIDAANVTSDPKMPGLFQIAHTKGSNFFSVKALIQRAATNINIRWNNKTYVIELVESSAPLYSVIFQYPADEPAHAAGRLVTPGRLLALLDKAKAYPFLKAYHPESVSQVEYLSYNRNPRVLDYRDYDIRLEEVLRFNPEDTLIFHVNLRSKSHKTIYYAPDGFSLRVGERTYPQSISDASGVIPPKGEAPAYFAVTGTPNGGRNDLSLKNQFAILLTGVTTNAPSQPLKQTNPEPHE